MNRAGKASLPQLQTGVIWPVWRGRRFPSHVGHVIWGAGTLVVTGPLCPRGLPNFWASSSSSIWHHLMKVESARPLKQWYIILPLNFMRQQSPQASPVQGEGKYTQEGKSYLEPFGIREDRASKRDKRNGITMSVAENILEHEPWQSLAHDYKARQTPERLSNWMPWVLNLVSLKGSVYPLKLYAKYCQYMLSLFLEEGGTTVFKTSSKETMIQRI